MGRPSDLSRRCCGNGPTCSPTPARGRGPRPSGHGSVTTTPRDPTRRSVTDHHVPAFRGQPSDQPCQKQQLVRGRRRRAAANLEEIGRAYTGTPDAALLCKRRVMSRILVVYGTTEGHTAKVAGAIAETLHRIAVVDVAA